MVVCTMLEHNIEGILVTTKTTKSVKQACILTRKFSNLQNDVVSLEEKVT